jgi:hypothetical protein
LRQNLKKAQPVRSHSASSGRLSTGFDSASGRVVRLSESAEESWDTAVGEPEPGEIRVNGF